MATITSFKDAVAGTLTAKQQAKVAGLDAKDRRLLWSVAERMARRQIERKTGQKLVGAVDWAKWIELLGPIFLKILAMLIGV